jgi:hypothetical protein
MTISSVLDAPGPETVVVDNTPNRDDKVDEDVRSRAYYFFLYEEARSQIGKRVTVSFRTI